MSIKSYWIQLVWITISKYSNRHLEPYLKPWSRWFIRKELIGSRISQPLMTPRFRYPRVFPTAYLIIIIVTFSCNNFCKTNSNRKKQKHRTSLTLFNRILSNQLSSNLRPLRPNTNYSNRPSNFSESRWVESNCKPSSSSSASTNSSTSSWTRVCKDNNNLRHLNYRLKIRKLRMLLLLTSIGGIIHWCLRRMRQGFLLLLIRQLVHLGLILIRKIR